MIGVDIVGCENRASPQSKSHRARHRIGGQFDRIGRTTAVKIAEGSARNGKIIQGQARDVCVRTTAFEVDRESLDFAVLVVARYERKQGDGQIVVVNLVDLSRIEFNRVNPEVIHHAVPIIPPESPRRGTGHGHGFI